MRSLSAATLLLIFSLQVLSPVWLMADYNLNLTDYLAKCINRSKPELKCNGKCQLSKKLAESEKQQQQKDSPSVHLKIEVLSSRSFPPVYECTVSSKSPAYPQHRYIEKTLELSLSVPDPPPNC